MVTHFPLSSGGVIHQAVCLHMASSDYREWTNVYVLYSGTSLIQAMPDKSVLNREKESWDMIILCLCR